MGSHPQHIDTQEEADRDAVYRHAFEGQPPNPRSPAAFGSGLPESPRTFTALTVLLTTRRSRNYSAMTMTKRHEVLLAIRKGV
jgi:hypothetical protein